MPDRHVDIFAAKPRPRNRAPALQLPDFAAALRESVTKMQKEYAAQERLRHGYEVLAAALKAASLPNEQALRLVHGDVRAQIASLPTDTTDTYAAVARDITARLHAADLRADTETPNMSTATYGPYLQWRWNVKRPSLTRADTPHVYAVTLTVSVRDGGIADRNFRYRDTMQPSYVVEWFDPRAQLTVALIHSHGA